MKLFATELNSETQMPLLTKQDLADELQCKPRTIDNWMKRGIGPPVLRIGRFIRFDHNDVAAWDGRPEIKFPSGVRMIVTDEELASLPIVLCSTSDIGTCDSRVSASLRG
jgi:predicted DNA-binding transcriptional regulator AlpA